MITLFWPFQKSGIEAIALSEFVTPSGNPLITINYKPLFPAKTNGWLFYKFNPWKPRFDQFLQRCLEAGLVKHYQDLTLQRAQSLYYHSDKEKNVVAERSSISPMTLEDLQVNIEIFVPFSTLNKNEFLLEFQRDSSTFTFWWRYVPSFLLY